jgi:hypothetical protein
MQTGMRRVPALLMAMRPATSNPVREEFREGRSRFTILRDEMNAIDWRDGLGSAWAAAPGRMKPLDGAQAGGFLRNRPSEPSPAVPVPKRFGPKP